MYIEIRFNEDNTATLEKRENGELLERKTCLYATKVMVWMVKQGHKWQWHRDLETGEEVAVWEKEPV